MKMSHCMTTVATLLAAALALPAAGAPSTGRISSMP